MLEKKVDLTWVEDSQTHTLALNISAIMPIPVSHEGLPSFCNCLFVINTAFKIGLRNSLILSQFLQFLRSFYKG